MKILTGIDIPFIPFGVYRTIFKLDFLPYNPMMRNMAIGGQ